ncbi:MAG TPA: lantibiotic dehydratase C-terminal domain-containing protein [Longimicrobium sp.]|nr:lantibiotic dehydratase C-terminal domain-containing protein [Longimicrobium sp.]
MLTHLAFNVYHWGDEPQRRLLVEALAPAVRALRAEGVARRVWYAAFDARGPHLFVLLSAPSARADELRERFGALLDAYLAAHPSTETIPPDVLQTRHDECRGKRLCAVDGEEDFAPNDSWRVCEQPADAFPFRLSAGIEDADALWDACGEWALWAVDRIAEGAGTAAGIRWTAALDGALARAGLDAAEYWRFHATTLLVRLQAALEHDEAASLAALPASVGEKNRAAFGRVWAAVEAEPEAWAGLDRLVALAHRPEGETPKERWGLLREINHCVLSQLQQPVRLRVPLVLHAWSRAVAEPAGAPA